MRARKLRRVAWLFRRARPLCLAMLAVAAQPLALRAADAEAPRAKHVIVLLADGAGFNTFLATAMYEGAVGRSLLDDERWVRLAASTYALCDRPGDPAKPPPPQDPTLVYDPARAWDPAPLRVGPRFRFAGYRWLLRAPDSANTATTISTGIKTYPGAINVDGAGRPIVGTLAWRAKQQGLLVGAITSVPWSHATPAALGGAHHRERSAYAALAREMLTSGTLDLIGGCGHPGFDEKGRPRKNPRADKYRRVGGRPTWNHLTGKRRLQPGDVLDEGEEEAAAARATADDIAALDRWTLVESREDIEALVTGVPALPLLMVPRVARTLQQEREASSDAGSVPPDTDPLLPGVPTLETMTRAALNALDDSPGGFLLFVEGGAVDWAMHDNRLGRTIEEMRDFLRAVEAVTDWVERSSSWDQTLVIVTADHDHLLWGPHADRVPFDPLQDKGEGRLPGHRWLADSHSAALVPVAARGAGAEALRTLATNTDPVRGPYVDQADIFRVAAGALGLR